MSEFVDVKTEDLAGVGLDWAIGQIEKPAGLRLDLFKSGELDGLYMKDEDFGEVIYSPSVYWGHGGPLVTSRVTTLCSPREGYWRSHAHGFLGERLGEGDTALIAVCRAVVASEIGETVAIPATLIEGE